MIDGPYIEELNDSKFPLRGSTNQQIYFSTKNGREIQTISSTRAEDAKCILSGQNDFCRNPETLLLIVRFAEGNDANDTNQKVL